MSRERNNMLDTLIMLLGLERGSDKESILEYLIESAKSFIENYCHCDYDDTFNSAVVSMVMEDYNKLESAGIESESFSGISQSYINGYSDSIMNALKARRRIKVL